MEKDLIAIEGERVGYGRVELRTPFGVGIGPGVTAVVGPNGSGKSTLGLVLSKGRWAYGNRLRFAPGVERVKLLTFTDIHSLGRMEAQYMAQRMESAMNDLVPTVAGVMGARIASPLWKELSGRLGLCGAEEKKVNFLSSGEQRKLLVIDALMDEPDVLVMDNPYIGLDEASRRELDLAMIAMRERKIATVLLLCDRADVPAFADRVLGMRERTLLPSPPAEEELPPLGELPEPPASAALPHEIAFSIRNGTLKYGTHTVLSGLDWTVRRGERWALTGPNGSGKSLLLSMVCADNPQGYANDIILFDRRRGSGESIWQIKDAIGYVSPEMQLFFRSTLTAREVAAQGLRRSIDRFSAPADDEKATADRWLALLGAGEIAGRRFSDLSAGEQRLVLTARALIAQPPLLILDEPLHGLDSARKRRVREVIDALAVRRGSSLIFVTHYPAELPRCVTLCKSFCTK